VVVTDQLDLQTLDLDTLSLGPISFGKGHTLVPAPGAQHYTGGVDLRPEQPLIVTVRATLEIDTGVLTWRFSSIDPNTGQLSDDANAGFLPPNVHPPEGDGSVTFSVKPKPGLLAGTQFCNEATIVFDVNLPITTPRWCNALDNAAPQSHVLPLAVSQPSPTFDVQWTGVDAGSGISSYSVYVSVDKGPVLPFQIDTASTSASFAGQAGKTYDFYSVARDAVGNIEAIPALFDATTTIAVAAVVGDLNGDGVVNCVDVSLVRASFGKRAGQAGFDPRSDVERDGLVNLRDLAFVSRRLPPGTTCS